MAALLSSRSGSRELRLLSAADEWGCTVGFFLLFAAVIFFFVKVANGDFAEWTFPWSRTRGANSEDSDGYARPLLSDDAHGEDEVVEL